MTGNNNLDARLNKVCNEKLTDDLSINVHEELESVLNEIGLSTSDAGGEITFYGADPIVDSTIALGSGASVGLMAKAVAATNIWRMRGGKGQALHVDLAKGLERLGVSYKILERLDGYPADIEDMTLLALIGFYKTKDGRHVMPSNIMPKLRNKMQGLLNCNNLPSSVSESISKWDSTELEMKANELGLVMGKVRTLEEFMQEGVYLNYLKDTKLIEIEKIGDSDPEPFSMNPATPLEGVRALGMGHVIAGAGIGRALACHGADVLNIWKPFEFEHNFTYVSADVGMRSSRLNYKAPEGNTRLKDLLKDSDVFFANRRPELMSEIGMTAEECATLRPGIIYCNTTSNGDKGPWANRPGFDQVAGAITGMMTFEGDLENPKIPVINVVNDYLVAWLASAGIMAALAMRAKDGGSYKVHVSLTRTSLWLLSLGIFDKEYVQSIKGTPAGHEEMIPELFTAQTPLGSYQGYTDQVKMSETAESYSTILVPRGSCLAVWLPRKPDFSFNIKL